MLTGEVEVPPPDTAPPAPPIATMEDFPLEQSWDETLRHAFDQVMKIDGCQVHPSTALTHLYFVVIRDRLYRANRDAWTGEELTQLLSVRVDVSRWCASCRECQLDNPPATPKAPLRPLPLIEVPFDRIAMDLIRPLDRSAQGYHFVLVLMDYTKRYPEAVPLRNMVFLWLPR